MELGVAQKNGKPGHPQTQGKIERWHSTLKGWLRKRPQAKNIEELQEQLDEFIHHYNNKRPHRSLHGHTPRETYLAKAKAFPQRLAAGKGALPGSLAERLGIPQDPTLELEETRRSSNRDGIVKGVRVNERSFDFNIGRKRAYTQVSISVTHGIATIVDLETGERILKRPIDTSKPYQHVPRSK